MATTQPYQIAFTRELTVPQNAIVGEIAPAEKQFKCEIIVNDALVAKYERRDICLSLLPLKPLEIPQYKLIITADFLRKLQKKDATAFFKLYHELGHIHHQDLINETEPDEEEQALRNAGKPSEADLAADQFAKSYMGLKNSLNALKEIRKEWEELCNSTACGDRAESNRAAKKEVQGRIEAIKLK